MFLLRRKNCILKRYLIERQASQVQLCRNVLKLFRDSDSARSAAILKLCFAVLFNLTSVAKEDKESIHYKVPGDKPDVHET
jgi:hypothetical protein